jgi:hypothetical protein
MLLAGGSALRKALVLSPATINDALSNPAGEW